MAELPYPYSYERHIAEQAVQRAVRATEHVRKNHIANTVAWKKDRSPVSLADYASQVLLIAGIHEAFPNDCFVGEETADDFEQTPTLQRQVWELISSLRSGDDNRDDALAWPESADEMVQLLELSAGESSSQGRVWTMDPIDGTMTYLDGTQYTVVATLLVDGVEQLGVIGCPRLAMDDAKAAGCDWEPVGADERGCMVSAVRGRGVHIRHLSGDDTLQPARAVPARSQTVDLPTLRYAENSRSVRPLLPERYRIAPLLGGSWNPMQICSTQLRYVVCALGRCDVLTRFPASQSDNAYVWDHAGGMLIFAEVGGRTTDLEGKEIDCSVGRMLNRNVGTLAAPAAVHAAVLGATRRVLEEFSDYKLNW
ncbi:hypothetical protein QBC44DRAFT_392218 [Cladorrhinum sp. PSN332]|nr:hypothetical protein QBC44DRAFT_392218 [Cladorrhinum sp. PSN332]